MRKEPIKNFDAAFLAFARNQSGPYQAGDTSNCALGQFVKSLGYYPGNMDYYATNNHSIKVDDYGKARDYIIGPDDNNTWEALVRRLELAGVGI